MITVFKVERDEVIKSSVSIASTNYRYALRSLYPLLDRFGEQRKVQSKKFYERLRADILKGCIMPPITLAFDSKEMAPKIDLSVVSDFINQNIKAGYVLDGMQRLNTLRDAALDDSFNYDRPLFLTIIIAERYDLLLYRMITLNNGQKPMTARHQIEMLTKGVIDTSGLEINVVSEKETEGTKIHGAFKKSDIVEAYIAYLTNSVNNQNSRIIESKLDEILVGKVMESNLSEANYTFTDILKQVDRLSASVYAKDWLRQVNNLIGFTVGMKQSYPSVSEMDPDELCAALKRFEVAFEAINPSKVNVGKFRRELSAYFFSEISTFSQSEVSDIEEAFFNKTLSE
ncbi:MAG: hypothetical protein ACK446_02445 [Rhodobacterales bacterium]